VGNAVSRANPEVQALIARRLPYCSMPQAVNRFAAAGREILLVTGTHGKTTTAALLAWVLQHAGRDPSFLIGGILKNFDSNFRVGRGGQIVLEGDEYDTAFFDKGPKFLHYPPRLAILTSVEFDHADIFRDLDHVRRAFAALVARIAPDALLLACADDPEVERLLHRAACRVERYGGDGRWRCGEIAPQGAGSAFSVVRDGQPLGRFSTRLPGRHNRANLLAVIAAASELGLAPGAIAAALERFAGVRRRQEIRGQARGVTVMDDFAHHPTAVRETIAAVRGLTAGRLIAVFEPRTNTSMRSVFQAQYATAFDEADLILIRQPPLLAKIPPGERFSSPRLAADLQRRGLTALFFPDTDGIIAHLTAAARPGDLVLVMSNGGFDDIHTRLLQALDPDRLDSGAAIG
jgi:UDP-N-acetylmuramate: L-alanyl-gamma-D-glutamyl-meso-diaminopimelate ligase